MTAAADVVFQEALRLSEDTRLDLIERLIVSSASYREVENEQLAVAQSRLEEMKSGVVKGVTVEVNAAERHVANLLAQRVFVQQLDAGLASYLSAAEIDGNSAVKYLARTLPVSTRQEVFREASGPTEGLNRAGRVMHVDLAFEM